MYFGSVKFFKHLILTVFFAWLSAATFLALFFGILYFNEKNSGDNCVRTDSTAAVSVQEAEAVKEKTADADGDLSLGQLFDEARKNGYTTEEILAFIEKCDEAAFRSYAEGYALSDADAVPGGTEQIESGAGASVSDNCTDSVTSAAKE